MRTRSRSPTRNDSIELAALEEGAAKVHPHGNRAGTSDYRRGDPDSGFAAAHEIVEASYRTASEMQTPLEPHGCVASWDGERLRIWESTQGVYAVQSVVAEVLGLSPSQVRVIGHYMGGGFGSKLDTSKYSIIAAQELQRAAAHRP